MQNERDLHRFCTLPQIIVCRLRSEYLVCSICKLTLKGQLTLTHRKVVRLVLAGFAQLIVLVTVLIRTVSPLIGPSFEVAGLCLTMTFIPPLFDMLNDRRERQSQGIIQLPINQLYTDDHLGSP